MRGGQVPNMASIASEIRYSTMASANRIIGQVDIDKITAYYNLVNIGILLHAAA